MERYPEEQFVNSLIGFGSRFKGDIEIDGLFRVDGDFSGSIKTEGKVLVGTHGRADCTVNARVVVIGGVFRGTIYAQEKILILSSAVVIGNLYTPRLVAEEGVLMHCSLVITGRREKSRTAVQSRKASVGDRGGDGGEAGDSPVRESAGRGRLFGRLTRGETAGSSSRDQRSRYGED
jgi:cytoskeletal protein CcmA (bactofilin family)